MLRRAVGTLRRPLRPPCRATMVSTAARRWSVTRPLPRMHNNGNDDAKHDDDDYIDEDDHDDSATSSHLQRRNPENIGLVQIPSALDGALREYTVPVLRAKRKADPSATPPSVHDFAAHRLDLAYAATYRVLHEARVRLPGLAPSRALDFGAGLTPFAWALHAHWGADAPETVAIEPNAKLRSLGTQLAGSAGLRVRWSVGLPAASDEERFDLVSAAYSLAALPAPSIEAVLASMWTRTSPGGLLALVEPATANGFAAILRARELLLLQNDGEAQLIAPCPHSQGCPLAPGAGVLPWLRADRRPRASVCHTVQRVVESCARGYAERDRRRGAQAKEVRESFCFLLVRRGERHAGREISSAMAAAGESDGGGDAASVDTGGGGIAPAAHGSWARVLRPPRKRAGHVMLDVCLPQGGASSITVSRNKTDSRRYRLTRKTEQGDAWVPPESSGRASTRALDVDPLEPFQLDHDQYEDEYYYEEEELSDD
jgi:ribosomal protein RSM22 (predicted rRNA methylase)